MPDGQNMQTTFVADIFLRDILILRVEDGRDFFISVSANFRPTAAGRCHSDTSSNKKCVFKMGKDGLLLRL